MDLKKEIKKELENKNKYRNVLLVCGWCKYEFTAILYKDKREERNILICPKCSHILSSSIKESTGNVVGRKHFHKEYKNGDTAI